MTLPDPVLPGQELLSKAWTCKKQRKPDGRPRPTRGAVVSVLHQDQISGNFKIEVRGIFLPR
jgi:hypothetical protein